MTLSDAIEQLYRVFARYPLLDTMRGCPCCVSESAQTSLRAKPLRMLGGDALEHYAFKAMTTWGTTADFKHFLPRILASLTEGRSVLDSIILGKLDYGEWRSWSAEEQEAIRAFLRAWWAESIAYSGYFDAALFVQIVHLLDDIEPMLQAWAVDRQEPCFLLFLDFVHRHFLPLLGSQDAFRYFGQRYTFLDWIQAQAPLLEQRFFEVEASQPKLAARISQALYWIEQSRFI